NKVGPDLLMARGNNRSRAWLYTQIIAPQTHNANTIMPPYAQLSNKNINRLINYLQNLQQPPGTPAAPPPPPKAPGGQKDAAASAKYGEQIYNSMGCAQCHTIQGTPSNKPGPDLVLSMKKDKPSKD